MASLPSSSSLAEASIARDIGHGHEVSARGEAHENGLPSPTTGVYGERVDFPTGQPGTRLSRRPSFTVPGLRPTFLPPLQVQGDRLNAAQVNEEGLEEERELLQDNQLVPPEVNRLSRQTSGTSAAWLWPRRGRGRSSNATEGSLGPTGAAEPSERSALLSPHRSNSGWQPDSAVIASTWDEAIAEGRIQTTWQRETKVLARYSLPLVLTFLLQYSLTVTSIFTVGHLGKVELGAVSLASMTANITGYVIYAGLSTSLDTLSAQAYGSGRRDLLGLQLQRMVYFLWCVTIPIGILWFSISPLLQKLLPDPELARLAGSYLKVVLIGAPGFAAFEAGKRFLQAQGLFHVSLGVLLVCAPLNVLMNWLFVWRLNWGYIGAPFAVAVTDNLLPLVLFLYVYFIDGRQCWDGFTFRAFTNWGPMVRLALPGLVMIEAEVLAFEILTLAASYLSTSQLAAQAVLANLAGLVFQIPFSLSIAASTRVANLIGAGLPSAARTSALVALIGALLGGALNMVLLGLLRNFLPPLLTNDPEVARLVAQTLPLVAAFQLFDAVATGCNGILRGLGKQSVGGWVNLFCYYAIAIPISISTAFALHWNLYGLWAGVGIALVLVSAFEAWFLYRIKWDVIVENAKQRNMGGD